MSETNFDFLNYLAAECISRFGNKLSKVCIVLPGRRASLFFQKSLAQQLQQSIQAPTILPIDNFFEHIAREETTERITLLLEAYEVHKTLKKEKAESLEDFMLWAEQALQDFNEIDNYLIDPDRILGNLKDIREIEEWSLNATTLSPEQEKYLEFWAELRPFYHALHKHFQEKKWFSSGSLRRYIWEKNRELLNQLPWDHVIVAGLNVLSKSEEKILFSLKSTGKASLYWDADKFYVNDKLQEAGMFLREYEEKIGTLTGITDNFFTEKKDYSIIACSSQISQARAINTLLQPENLNDRTAIVLADESLLIPVLHALPEKATDVNVTLGYPLKNAPVFALMDAIFKLHLRANKNPRGKGRFYYKDILNIIQNPALPSSIQENQQGIPLSRILKEYKLIYPSFNDIRKHSSDQKISSLEFIFLPVSAASDMIILLKQLLEFLKNHYREQNDLLGNEFAFHFGVSLAKIQGYINKYSSIASLDVLHQLMRQLLAKEQIPFFGEPLKGLQIMGMLETRSVSFDKVIILGANEDKLPKSKINNSLIPFDLRKAFGMPTHRHRDAMYAYYFYRLISRSKSISILYNSEPSAFALGERSRFITQLEYYLQNAGKSSELSHSIVQSPIPSASDFLVQIPSSPSIREKMNQLCSYGISPTAINAWRRCPLDFFYKYIADFREAEEIEEKLEDSTFGSVVHRALEILYTPLIGKKLSPELIIPLRASIESAVIKSFEEYYSLEELEFGANRLSKQVAIGFTRRFIEHDIRRSKELIKQGSTVTLLALEKTLKASFDLSSYGYNGSITLKGKADRIEAIDKDLIIIDYKTGVIQPNKVVLKSNDIDSIQNADGFCIQLMCYLAMAGLEKSFEGLTPKAALLSLRTLSSGLIQWSLGKEGSWNEEVQNVFLEYLAAWMNEVNTPELVFSHKNSAKYCTFCH